MERGSFVENKGIENKGLRGILQEGDGSPANPLRVGRLEERLQRHLQQRPEYLADLLRKRF